MGRDIFIYGFFQKEKTDVISAKAFFVSLNAEDQNGEV
jgi:hypothetical protein